MRSGRGIGSTLGKILESPIVKNQEEKKKVRNKKTHKILDSDLVNMLVDKGSQYAINKLQ